MSKHMADNDPQKWWMTMFQTQIVSQRKINDCYSFATISIDRKMNRLRFQMIIYRFQVIQTSGDPSLAIVMLLEPYGVPSPPYILLHIKVQLPVLLCAVKTVEGDFRFCWTISPNVGQTHKENPKLVRIFYMIFTLNDTYKQYNKLHEH